MDSTFHRKGKTNGTQPYSALPAEALLGNSLGVLIVAFGLVVFKILSNHRWQRPDSRPGDMTYAVRRQFAMKEIRGTHLIKHLIIIQFVSQPLLQEEND